MLHSPYVAVRLQTWHDKGRRLLQDMLVKMGFPAPQFRQKWSEYLTPASYSFAHMLVKMGFPAPQFRQKWSEYLKPASYSFAHMLVKMGFPAPQFRQKWSECLTAAPCSFAHMQMCDLEVECVAFVPVIAYACGAKRPLLLEGH